MGAVELRNKLIESFNKIIQDDSKLLTLEGVFDSINTTDSPSLVSDSQYEIVEERREKYLSGESSGKEWDEVKQELKKKYGF